jgi:hypothetical protein
MCGSNDHGQLATGDYTDQPLPTKSLIYDVLEIALGLTHSGFITTD